jgi:hypothetical protein
LLTIEFEEKLLRMRNCRLLFLLTLLALAALFSCSTNHTGSQLKIESFQNPPDSFAVHTWWHWMDNAITKEGITKDLASMKEQGISQATILNVSQMNEADLGVSPVIFNTPEWYDLFKWSLQEANRLGLKIGIQNCDGWATSGGPWITPENSMKRCTWSKSIVSGGKTVSLKLTEPGAKNNFYRDTRVLAFRSGETDNSFMQASPKILVDGTSTFTNLADGNKGLEPFKEFPFQYSYSSLYDGNPLTGADVNEGSIIDIAFEKPFLSEKMAIHFRRKFQRRPFSEVHFNVVLKASSDGNTYRDISRITDPGLNQTRVFEFPAVSARYYRLIIQDQNDSEKGRGLTLAELELLKSDELPRYNTSITNHLEKIVTTKAELITDFFSNNLSPSETVQLSDVVDITEFMDADGLLNWKVPEGNWTILRVGYTTTGHTNHPATKAGRGLEVDKMDTAALNLHFKNFPLKLIEQAGQFTGNTFRFLLIDSWECKYQNWTDQFAEEFQKRRGYSIYSWLPVICGVVVESPESTERFLQDYRLTIADLIEENYYRHYSKLCREHGLQAHSEVIYGGDKGEGATIFPPVDNLKSNSYLDLPMYEFWASDINYKPVKQATVTMVADAAALYGKSIVGSEAYTGYANYEESPWDLKLYGDNAFCSGINQMLLHSYVHQPDERKPGFTLGPFGQSFNRHIPWWEFSSQWFDYQARVQYVLQQGVRSADLLYFTGDNLYEPDIEEKGVYNIPYGYSVQRCNRDILLNHSRVKNGKIVLSNGISYKLLLMPGDEGMELTSLRRIAELVKQGAILVGAKPTRTLSYKNHEDEEKELHALVDVLWGNPKGNLSEGYEYGKGKVFPISDIQSVCNVIGLKPEFFSLENDSQNLLYITKKVGDDDIFYVVNQEDKPVDRICSFRASGKYPEIWDPAYGTVTIPAEFSETDGVINIPMSFQPRESLFFVFRKNRSSGIKKRQKVQEIFQLKKINGTVSFNSVGSNEPLAIDTLKSLSAYDEPAIKYFAGIADYKITFNLPANISTAVPLFISPGNFKSSCQLTLNGTLLGNTTFPNYRFDVTGLVTETGNVLEIRVGNNFRNRIVGDYIEHGELKNVWTTNPSQGKSDARFPNKNTTLQESGLMGPVTFYSYN